MCQSSASVSMDNPQFFDTTASVFLIAKFTNCWFFATSLKIAYIFSSDLLSKRIFCKMFCFHKYFITSQHFVREVIKNEMLGLFYVVYYFLYRKLNEIMKYLSKSPAVIINNACYVVQEKNILLILFQNQFIFCNILSFKKCQHPLIFITKAPYFHPHVQI